MNAKAPSFWFSFFLFLVTFFAYFPVFQADFISNWDDNFYLTENHLFEKEDALYRIWFTSESPSYYPLTFTLLYLMKQGFQLQPFYFHLLNFFLHLLNLYLLGKVLSFFPFTRKEGPCLVLILYALHPAQVESVAWITEVKNLLSGVFYWASFWAFFLYLSPQSLRKRTFYSLSFLCFLGAVLAKGMAVTLPASFLLWLMLMEQKSFLKGRLKALIPFFLVSVLFSGITIFEEEQYRTEEVQRNYQPRPFETRLQESLHAFFFYPLTLIFPFKLSPIYPKHWIPLTLGTTLLCFFLLVFLLSLAGYFRKTQPLFLFCLVNYGIVASPILGFVSTTYHDISIVADRYFYPSVPFLMILFASLLEKRFSVFPPVFKKVSLLILCCFLGFLTFQQSQRWKNPITLWEYASTQYSHPQIEYHLGMSYFAEKDWEKARSAFKRALELSPFFDLALHHLGRALIELKEYEEAELSFRRLIEFNDQDGKAWNNLGVIFDRKQGGASAVLYYEKALSVSAPSKASLVRLGECYLERYLASNAQDREAFEKAEKYFLQALHEKIQANQAQIKLIQLFFKDYERALPYLQSALNQDPQNPRLQRIAEEFYRYHQKR